MASTAEALDGFESSGSTLDERSMRARPAREVIERVNEILGYDLLLDADLMAEGYRESAEDDFALAESNLGAAFVESDDQPEENG